MSTTPPGRISRAILRRAERWSCSSRGGDTQGTARVGPFGMSGIRVIPDGASTRERAARGDTAHQPTPRRVSPPPMTEPSAYSWAPLTRWRCLRCGDVFLTREVAPTCPWCGFSEDGG